jgi:hypothetical protein
VAECWLQMRMFNLPKWLLYRFFHYACIAREPRYSVLVYPICTPGSVVAASLIKHRTVRNWLLFSRMFWSLPTFVPRQVRGSAWRGPFRLLVRGKVALLACVMAVMRQMVVWSCGHVGGAHHVHDMTTLSYVLSIISKKNCRMYHCSRKIIINRNMIDTK